LIRAIGPLRRIDSGAAQGLNAAVIGSLFETDAGEVADRIVEVGGVVLAHGLDRDGAGQLTRDRAAHSIGDGEQVGACVAAVLVTVADQANVGTSGIAESERHRRYFLSSRTVLPTRKGVPNPTGVGP
jgi:hypothetical protein